MPQLDAVAIWIHQYQKARQMYITVSELVKSNADVVVNGLLSIDEIVGEIMAGLNIRTQ